MTQSRAQRLRVRLGRLAWRVRPAWPPTLAEAEPPELGPGESTGPPHFVGIGAARCGSTWWSRQLRRHPRIVESSKELHYFDGYYSRTFTPADRDRYQRYFPRGPEQVVGEWTPGYLYLPWVPELLADAAPDARHLCILRDPVEQFVSSINYSAAHHGAPDNALMVSRHLAEATFGHHLAHWRRVTEAPLLLLQLERCRDEPDAEFARTMAFLDLDPSQARPLSSQPANAGKEQPIEVTEHLRRSLVEYFEPDVVALAQQFAEIDPGRWPNFAHLG